MNLFLLDDGRLRAGWRFAVAVIMVLVANFIAGSVGASVGGERARVEDIIYRPLLMLLLLGCFAGMTKIFDQPQGGIWTYNGLPKSNWFRQTLAGALLGCGLIFLAVIIVAIFFRYQITKIVLNPHTLRLPPVIAIILLTGAMAEELMFRGYPFQRLVEGIGNVGAIVVLSALFGAVHLHNPHVSDSLAVQVFAFTNTLLIGVVFALAYLRTRALWLPWGLHFSWNITMGLIFGLPVSGISEFAVLVKAKMQGPAWLLGGGYGLEGGFLGTVLIIIALSYVMFFVRPALPREPKVAVDEAASPSIQSSGSV